MTLNVSLRVPDGIVMASDSLSTLTQPVNQRMTVSGKCDKCGESVEIRDVQTPPMSIPSSTWPYAQKLFPIQGRFGLATYGMAFVNERSIYNHVIELAPNLPQPKSGTDQFEALADFIGAYFQKELENQLNSSGLSVALQPDEWCPLGFQFVGFSKPQAAAPISKTRLIQTGKAVRAQTFEKIGCTISGDTAVAQMLFQQANWASFSLQDAIDYAKFLIRTTSDFQRFSGKMPTVGGDIDISLLTHHRGFQWIAQKELYRTLERTEVPLTV
ncbi:MAG TPA: hypothetical protein VNX27_01935 [Chthoniobacterales bacterium]|nr:hypothetical protein [Chthoniobacterales bacterium]